MQPEMKKILSNNNLQKEKRRRSQPQVSPIPSIAAIALLILLTAIGAIPGYISGNWSWANLPPVTNLSQIRNLRQTGLTLPNSKTVGQKKIALGAHQWLAQIIQKSGEKPVILLLQTQDDHREQPEVEWMDINGFERWKTDSYRQLNFPVDREYKVKARFFRAWNQRQTFAVVQWYATPQGGNYSPAWWFWADQLAQLRGTRVPWIAVCLQIPMEPLGDLNVATPKAKALAQEVQTALILGPFSR
ncbi:MAG: cyanoexosortase B system-associated protein [Gomphosphaeria aponina SAG 52.96 = DSM 107014]|uniref:Cyanoexosortase B system-associated protein n=1 Tax=Gomphosphaeria aponina SAG 52.96 = DSM 107014 TaxID=1521640 RepID=A0A941GUG9_9CHRO|nr:cyanoexosortase B system-associated protein [Gomphosphaeria aponina SAG 52.96 = DSM 107014]